MHEATLSVKDLLGIPEQGLPAGFLTAGISDEEAISFKSKITGVLEGMQWSGLEAAAGSKFSDILDIIDPVTLFAGAWEKYKLLSDAAERSKSGQTEFVRMAEHPVTSKLHPYVEIRLGPDVIRDIQFEVTLSLKLKGIIVRVESGEIRGIEAGTCEGSAEVVVSECSIWKHDIEPINLPGKIRLRQGIPIHSTK
jgi:hypothetical protein